MTTNTKTLQKQAAQMAAQNHSNKTIAEKLGVQEKTIERWRASPVFKRAFAVLLQEKRQNLELRKLILAQRVMAHLETKAQGMDLLKADVACRILSVLKGVDKPPSAGDQISSHKQESAAKRPKPAATEAV